MSYTIAKQVAANLDAQYDAAIKAHKAVEGVGTGPMGLTPDSVRATEVYKVTRANMDRAFSALRAFNGQFTKQYRKEIAVERKVKRAEWQVA